MADTETTPPVASAAPEPPVEDGSPKLAEAEAKKSSPAKAGVPPKRPTTGKTGTTRPTTTKPSTSTTKPTTASSRTTAGSTLNKPPARPATTSTTTRKPATGTTSSSTGTTTHKPRMSTSSIDTADEKKKSSISGAPRRVSIAPSVSSTRPSTTKTVSATPDKRSSLGHSAVTEKKPIGRASTTSPTKTTRPTPSTPGHRASATTTTSRSTKPAVSSTLKSSTATEGRKRLSTIPASPAVKSKSEPADDDKENEVTSGAETSTSKGPTRPPLGHRQSTRSAALQQRMREFEIVNEMLQAAMAAEDAGDDIEQTKISEKVEQSMLKLKNDLEKAKAVENGDGHGPEDSELGAEAATETERGLAETAAASAKDATDETSVLKLQLEESNGKVEALQKELENIQVKMAEFGKSAEEEAVKVQDATSAIRAEHAAKVDELSAIHASEIAPLNEKIKDSEVALQERAEHALKDLDQAKQAAQESGDSKVVQALEEQEKLHVEALRDLQNQLSSQKEASDASQARVDELQTQLAKSKEELESATQNAANHAQTLEMHENELSNRDRELKGQGSVIKSLQDEITALQQSKTDDLNEEKERAATQVADLEAKVEALTTELEQSKNMAGQSGEAHKEAISSKDLEIKRLGEVIEKLQSEIQSVQQNSTDQLEIKLVEIRQEHDQIVQALKSEHTDKISALTETHSKTVEKLSSEAMSSREAHEDQLKTLNTENDTIKGELERLSVPLTTPGLNLQPAPRK